MDELFQELNYSVGEAIGLTLLDPKVFTSLLIRFIINLSVVSVIARYFYFPKSRRRDYMFIFIIMSMCIFMLVSLMGPAARDVRLGAAPAGGGPGDLSDQVY